MISFSCPQCGNSMNVKPQYAGKKGKCKSCGETIRVPPPQSEPVQELIVNNDELEELPSIQRQSSVRPQAPPLPQQQQNNVTVQVQQEKKTTSSLGITSIIIGTLAFFLCWIPLVNLVSLLLGIVGLAMASIGGLMAIFRKGTGVGFSIGGGVLSLVALVISGLMWSALVFPAVEMASEAARKTEERKANRESGEESAQKADNQMTDTHAKSDHPADLVNK